MWQNDLTAQFIAWIQDGWLWLRETFLEPERLIELVVIVVAFTIGRIAGGYLVRVSKLAASHFEPFQKIQDKGVKSVLVALVALLLIWSAIFLLSPLIGTLYLLPLATSLLVAWVIIRVLVGFIANKELARLIAVAIWILAALNILGFLPVVVEVLDGAVLPFGEAEVSVLDIITGFFTLGILVWAALTGASLLDRRLKTATHVPASARVLIAKAGRFVLLAIAFFIALNATGIDLTAFAVFGGALGVGIGFGLQKVVGNFISGLILLLDRSIKPGDVIETGGTYGTINKLAARYTSVITRDGTEFLIPNEDMITQPVINWSHSNLLVRRKIPLQVSYQCDIERAMALMVEAAEEESRVLKNPAPRSLLRGFGDNGVNLELRMWITDPEKGVSNIASIVMLRIWNKFKDSGIEFPYPQRVVHLINETPDILDPSVKDINPPE